MCGMSSFDDRVAVGAEVRRVHGVRIVVVRVRVLDLDDQEPREARAGPVLVELVRVLLFGPVVARPVEAVAVHGLQVRVRGRLAEAVEVVRKVTVVDDERIPRLRVRVPAFRQQHVRAEEHRPPPELREELALDADVLDVLRVRRIGNRRDDLVEDETDGAAPLRVDRQLLRRAEEIARRPVPLLALAPVHRELHRVAVRAAEGLVAVQQGLHRVRAWRDLVEAGHGVAEDRGIEDGGLPRRQPFNIHAEDLLRLHAVADLEARLAGRLGREHQQHAAVDRLRPG